MLFAAALAAEARETDEIVSHQIGGNDMRMDAVLPIDVFDIIVPPARFVNGRRCPHLEAVIEKNSIAAAA